MKKILKKINLIVFLGFFWGCSLKQDEGGVLVSILFPQKKINLVTSSFISGRSFWLYNAVTPSGLSDFDCYGVNVTGPGIAPSANQAVTDPNLYFGVIGGLVPVAQGGVEVLVPPGDQRTFQLFGITSSSGICPSIHNILSLGTDQAADIYGFDNDFELARSTIDILGDTSLTMAATYDAANPIKMFGGQDDSIANLAFGYESGIGSTLNVKSGRCTRAIIRMVNPQGKPVSNQTGSSRLLSVIGSGAANFNFYANASCTLGPYTDFALSENLNHLELWFIASTGASLNIGFEIASLDVMSTVTTTAATSGTENKYSLALWDGRMVVNQCYEVWTGVRDIGDVPTTTSGSPTGFQLTASSLSGNLSASEIEVYSDGTCSAFVGDLGTPPNLSIGNGTYGSYYFIKVRDTGSFVLNAVDLAPIPTLSNASSSTVQAVIK